MKGGEIGDRVLYLNSEDGTRAEATIIGHDDMGYAIIKFDDKTYAQNWHTEVLRHYKQWTVTPLVPAVIVPDVPLGKWGTLL